MNGRKLWRWREDGPGSREEPRQAPQGGKARWWPSEAQPESSLLVPSAPAFKTLSQLVPTHWASRESWVGHCICRTMASPSRNYRDNNWSRPESAIILRVGKALKGTKKFTYSQRICPQETYLSQRRRVTLPSRRHLSQAIRVRPWVMRQADTMSEKDTTSLLWYSCQKQHN